MEITFQCGECGRWYTANEQRAGKTVKCGDCGAAVKIPPAPDPSPADMDVYGMSEMDTGSKDISASGRSASREPSSPPPRATSTGSSPRKGQSSNSRGFFGGGLGTIGILVFLAIRVYYQWERHQARQARRNNQALAAAPFPAAPASPRPSAAPWKMPALPPPTQATEIEPGVMLSEITLKRDPQAGTSPPGHAGKLWLYLPRGDHAPRSLPCILIAGAGSNLITGMDLGNGDRPEHLPYARAGFAVLAYELDGRLAENDKDNIQALARASSAFLAAEAGLVNARVAIEYATTRVPAVDPNRLYAVGHSSAATLALLVAENMPRIAACVAFAPAVDLASQHPPDAQKAIAQLVPGGGQFYSRFNPRVNESKIECPLFLFYADDDARFAGQVRDLGARLVAAGKQVTVSSVESGGHYDSMLKVGVPRAIEWLRLLPGPIR